MIKIESCKEGGGKSSIQFREYGHENLDKNLELIFNPIVTNIIKRFGG